MTVTMNEKDGYLQRKKGEILEKIFMYSLLSNFRNFLIYNFLMFTRVVSVLVVEGNGTKSDKEFRMTYQTSKLKREFLFCNF